MVGDERVRAQRHRAQRLVRILWAIESLTGRNRSRLQEPLATSRRKIRRGWADASVEGLPGKCKSGR